MTPTQENKIQSLTDALVAATDSFFDVDDTAYTKYLADARAQAAKQTFEDWVLKKYPAWTAASDKMDTANANLDQYKTGIYGPAYSSVTKLKQRVEGLSQNQDTPQNGYVLNKSLSQVLFERSSSIIVSLSVRQCLPQA